MMKPHVVVNYYAGISSCETSLVAINRKLD